MPDLGNSSVFSQTDASNNSGTMPSWSGAAAPSTLDDAGRAFQGAVTREWNWRNYTVTATGTADAKVLTYSVAPAAYYNGQKFAFIANTTNTTSATLNVNSLGAKTIKKDVSGTLTNLSASDMAAGNFCEVAYNTANDCFVWVNQAVSKFGAGTVSAPSITTTGDTNTGFWFPAADTVALSTGGTERWRVDSSGRLGVGLTPSASKLEVQDVFDGNLVVASIRNISNVSANTAASLDLRADQSWVRFTAQRDGAGTSASFTISPTVAGTPTERVRITVNGGIAFNGATNYGTSGQFLKSNGDAAPTWVGDLLVNGTGSVGYATGSGGTVTQLTSKATGVTINKTNGQIITNNAILGANNDVTFTVTNSTVAATDTIIICKASGGASNKYDAIVGAVAAGSFDVVLRNISASSGSDVVTLNFAVIKAVTA